MQLPNHALIKLASLEQGTPFGNTAGSKTSSLAKYFYAIMQKKFRNLSLRVSMNSTWEDNLLILKVECCEHQTFKSSEDFLIKCSQFVDKMWAWPRWKRIWIDGSSKALTNIQPQRKDKALIVAFFSFFLLRLPFIVRVGWRNKLGSVFLRWEMRQFGKFWAIAAWASILTI